MRKFLFAILLLIVIGFGFVGFTNLDTDANPPIPQESEEF